MIRMRMTPQQKVPSKDLGSWLQEGGKKMRASVQRRRSSSAITRALGRTKPHPREINMIPAHSGNGLLLGAFCSPNNMFILREKVHLSSGWQTQERHLFLFSDSLIIAKSKSSTMKLKKHVRLSEMWISTCLGEVSEKKYYPEDSFVIGWPTANYVVTFSSSETKEKWLSTLCWHINEVKKNEYPRKIPISVLYLDADEFMSNTTITVCNTDDAEKVIKQATQQLGIPGRPSDYHLWVMSAKDESLYPLFGHEQPYSIAMNCVRESMDTPRGSNNNIPGTDSTEDMYLEQFPQERLCQFIIKMKPQVPLYMRRGPTQKHCRRKKSLIDWALRRTGSTTLSSASSQSPLTPRKLFGHSLSSVCHNGNLPKPIMDMLLLLYEEGPHTRGIFRRSANAKTCKELKEKLISGDEVHMDGESVFVAAAVITDFLRNIPDSILSSDMHGLWMEVAEIEEPEYKIKVIKSLMDQLPEANFILLQYLFAVLNHIEKNSEENQMTASNLSVCIAPNMLWLPSVSDPEEESKSTKKVALLVQFLIENYKLIFGQDAEFLFSKHEKQESGSTDDLSGIHLMHGQDSSDDLEFASSDLDKSDTNLLKDEDVMFDESLLLEKKEDWDLFSEIAACYQSKTKMDILECYNNDPLNPIGSGSACFLSPNRDRCSSEPSVCLSSKHSTQVHEPVARQSSCDATIIHNHIDYINQLKQLRLESQKLLKDELGPNIKNTPRAFWRSNQACIMKERNSQKITSSSRSSISSLSSTTTSPSVSSLSSLDSAFSYCSESSVFSPSDVTSLPFMFGTSARLHTLSPEITKKKLREWHIPMNTLFGGTSCDLDSWEMQWEMDNVVKDSDKANNGVPVHSEIRRVCLDKEPKENFYFPVQAKETVKESGCNHFIAEAGHCVQKETSVKQIEIRRQASSNDDGLQRTKVTFFMSPNIMSVKSQSDQNLNTDSVSQSSVSQSRKFPIPQTVFYGQNAPLHSVSRKHHPEVDKPCWQSQLKHVLNRGSQNETITNKASKDLGAGAIESEILNKEQKLKEPHTEGTIKHNAHAKNHSKSITSFSQSIRIILPSSVKNTMKDYFKHTDPKSPSTSQEVTVESNLIQNKTENCNLQQTEEPRETKGRSCIVEESFV